MHEAGYDYSIWKPHSILISGSDGAAGGQACPQGYS